MSNILQSDWLRTFWTTSQEQKFPKIWDLCRNTVNIINFHYRRNSVKISNQFFNKYKKDPVFGLFFVHFPNLWGKKKFPENPAWPRTTSHGFLAPSQNLEKTYLTIPRKRPDRGKDGRTERRTEGRTNPSGYCRGSKIQKFKKLSSKAKKKKTEFTLLNSIYYRTNIHKFKVKCFVPKSQKIYTTYFGLFWIILNCITKTDFCFMFNHIFF